MPTNFGEVAHTVVEMLMQNQYTKQDFDRELPAKSLQNLFDFLDFSRLYFTKPQIEAFRAKYAETLDDEIATHRIDAAHDIYGSYLKRVVERTAKIKALIDSGKIDFTTKDTVEISRKESDWAPTEEALDDLWRREIVREILQERLNLKHAAERKAEKAATEAARPKADTPEKAAPKATAKVPDSPEVKVLKRHQRYLETLKQNEEEDISDFLVSSIAQAYDPHSDYMSYAEQASFNIEMRKALFGIGAELQTQDGVAVIKRLIPNGPADKEGSIQRGDLVLGVAQGIDGEMIDIEGLKLQKIVEKIRGNEGTTVRLKVQPGDDPTVTREIAILRAKVEMKDTLAKGELIEIANPTDTAKAPLKVGWINLESFYADMERRDGRSASRDVRAIVQRLMKEGSQGMVLDLRGNGGGSLEEAIKMTGIFIKPGPVVQQRDFKDRRETRNWKLQPLYTGPLVVLTDRTSASASEICAAALQDYGRAVVVGDESTFGKGTVQTVMEVMDAMPQLSDKARAGSLKVTIAKFYRIDGRSTQNAGVRPDIILPSRFDAIEIGERFLKDPLPYDTIDPQPFAKADCSPLPMDVLRAASATRVKNSPDFANIREYVARNKDLVAKNTLSLNEAERLAEDKVNSDRVKSQKEERKARVREANRDGDPYRVFPVTLDNAEQTKLKLDSEVKREEAALRKSDSNTDSDDEDEDDNAAESEEIYPHGFDPTKLEAMNVLKDLIEHSQRPADTTAKADPAKADR
jgi:carboxyl-terminal processing protease